MDKMLDYLVVILYFAAMIGAGYWSLRRARSAMVLGGASTIGGVGLGYQYGVSGMWLVFMLGLGDYTVSEMLGIR